MGLMSEDSLHDLVHVIERPSPTDLAAIKERVVAISSTRHPLELSRPLGCFVCHLERADSARRKGTLRARQRKRPHRHPMCDQHF